MAFLIAVVLGMVSSRAQMVGERGGFQPSMLLIFSGGTKIIAFLTLIVWGFFSLEWYWAFGAIIAGFIGTFLVTRQNVAAIYLAASFLNLVTIGIAAYLWIAYWPF